MRVQGTSLANYRPGLDLVAPANQGNRPICTRGGSNLATVAEAHVYITDDFANPDFFTDMLKVVGESEIEIEFKDSASAALAKAGKNYVYVVMPVQLQEA